MARSITYECEECGHQEERMLHVVYGVGDYDDDYEVEGDEVVKCPTCGSTDLTEYVEGGRLRDNGREDFHSDG